MLVPKRRQPNTTQRHVASQKGEDLMLFLFLPERNGNFFA